MDPVDMQLKVEAVKSGKDKLTLKPSKEIADSNSTVGKVISEEEPEYSNSIEKQNAHENINCIFIKTEVEDEMTFKEESFPLLNDPIGKINAAVEEPLRNNVSVKRRAKNESLHNMVWKPGNVKPMEKMGYSTQKTQSTDVTAPSLICSALSPCPKRIAGHNTLEDLQQCHFEKREGRKWIPEVVHLFLIMVLDKKDDFLKTKKKETFFRTISNQLKNHQYIFTVQQLMQKYISLQKTYENINASTEGTGSTSTWEFYDLMAALHERDGDVPAKRINNGDVLLPPQQSKDDPSTYAESGKSSSHLPGGSLHDDGGIRRSSPEPTNHYPKKFKPNEVKLIKQFIQEEALSSAKLKPVVDEMNSHISELTKAVEELASTLVIIVSKEKET